MAGPKHVMLYPLGNSMWLSYMDGTALYRMIMRTGGYFCSDPVIPEEFYYLTDDLRAVYTIKECRSGYAKPSK